MWYLTPVSNTASISGERRPRNPWAPNAPIATPKPPSTAPANMNVLSIYRDHTFSGFEPAATDGAGDAVSRDSSDQADPQQSRQVSEIPLISLFRSESASRRNAGHA